MNHRIPIHRRGLTRLAVVLAVAAIAVPSAQAAQISLAGAPSHGAQIATIEQPARVHDQARQSVEASAPPLDPSDVSGHRVGYPWGPTTAEAPDRPDDRETPAPARGSPAYGSSFDWADFGIGAGLGVAVSASLLGALLIVNRLHGRPTTA